MIYQPRPVDGYVGTGKLRALAIRTATRSDALPDIPKIGEFVRGCEASSIFGLGAPKNTPTEITDKLNKEINADLTDPKFKARLAHLDGTELVGSSADFGKLIADETRKGQRDPAGQYQAGMRVRRLLRRIEESSRAATKRPAPDI